MAKLKVFVTDHARINRDLLRAVGSSDWAQQGKAIVATTTQANAARLFGMSTHMLRAYGSETSNDEQIRVAMSEPGVVFVSTVDFASVKTWLPATLNGSTLVGRDHIHCPYCCGSEAAEYHTSCFYVVDNECVDATDG